MVAFTVIGAFVAAIPSDSAAEEVSVDTWTASHTLLVNNTSIEGDVLSDPLTFNQLELFAVTGEVPLRVAERLDFGGEPAALAAQVQVEVSPETGALRITTTQESAGRAEEIADAFAEELTVYLAERQDELQTARLAASLDTVERLDAEIKELEERVEADPDDTVLGAELSALSREYSLAFEQNRRLASDSGQLQLTTLERAQAVGSTQQTTGLAAPSSRTSRAVLGGIVGFVLGAAIALLLSRTDRRVRTRTQAETIVGQQCEAIIPLASNPSDGVVVAADRHEPLSDSYRTLRTVVDVVEDGAAQRDGRAPTVLVVSATPGDGKTEIASNLAAALAESGESTIAVNTDFRRPALSRRLTGAAVDSFGFSAQELTSTSLELLIAPTRVPGVSVFDLAGNDAPPIALARITATRLDELIRGRSDAVVIDSSPIGAAAEVLEVIPHADVIVFVVRLDHTRIEPLERAVETLRTIAKARIVLVVVGERQPKMDYYEYLYGGGSPERSATAPSNAAS